ncbi:MAG: hypothetical protein KUG68_00745, partial [Flavobacteriaceae bacterium]|nr:hypothetical protein [Flavobacteriaceae bacterium]
STLFGIIIYRRESKTNKLYRFANKISHSKELQMKPENRKGFVHQQPFLIRLVWIALLFVVVFSILSFINPFSVNFIQYFATAIVGTLVGTYITSAVLFTNSKVKKENLEKAIKKGKDFIEDIADGEEEIKNKTPEESKEEVNKDAPQEKSARDRLKDKGMIN